MKTNIYIILPYIDQFLLEIEMFQTKVLEKIRTRILLKHFIIQQMNKYIIRRYN